MPCVYHLLSTSLSTGYDHLTSSVLALKRFRKLQARTCYLMYTKFEHFVSFCFLDSRTQRLELWIDVPNIVIFFAFYCSIKISIAHADLAAAIHHAHIIMYSHEYWEAVEAVAMELTDTASHYIKSVTTSTCVSSAFTNADVIILHDNDIQVNISHRSV